MYNIHKNININRCKNLEWDIAAYKDLNKIASAEQGRTAQTVAMSFNLNPPPGFSRVSEWSTGYFVVKFV